MNISQQLASLGGNTTVVNAPVWRTLVDMTSTGGEQFSSYNPAFSTAQTIASDTQIEAEIKRKLDKGFAMLFEKPTNCMTLCGTVFGTHSFYHNQKPTFNQQTKVHLSIGTDAVRQGLRLNSKAKLVEAKFTYDDKHRSYYNTGVFVSCIMEFQDELMALQIPFALAKPLFNASLNSQGVMSIHGIDIQLELQKIRLDETPEFSLRYAHRLHSLLGVDMDTIMSLIQNTLPNSSSAPMTGMATNGINKTVIKITPWARQLFTAYPLLYAMLCDITHLAKRTVNNVKMSTVFNQVFANINTYDELVAFLKSHTKHITNSYSRQLGHHTEDVLANTPEYNAIRKTSLQSGARRAFNKLMEDIDFLNLDENQYPKLYKAITDGEIPLSTFFRKKEQYFLLNSNWQLWEEMLGHQPELAKELAKEVSRRTTYEKDLMSYFYFLLYGLPEYLLANTGRSWRVYGKLVESEHELEAPREDQAAGVTKKRSALTPIVENEMNTVVVPYASLALSGRQTTYCYSHDYHVLQRGFSFNGNTVMRDCEVALNGRDDYGLMFYTLTGSYNARGYPTFLIIFEKRSDQVYVHFHRTHPCRSKDGDYNPIHDWVRVCYNWMVGNVPAQDIVVQQGDMVFVKHDHQEECIELVKAYEGHCFDQPVKFAAYAKKVKANVLGFINVDTDTWLRHQEHEDVLIPKGDYEVRQCRSWEANPVGVWTLRID